MDQIIKSNSILSIKDLENYKLHLSCFNGERHPLDVFVKSCDEWEEWNAWRKKANHWNRKYIFSLMEFYPEKNEHLFGGIFEVIEREEGQHYKIQLVDLYSEYIGRLKIHYERPRGLQGRSFRLETYFEKFTVSEILKTRYSGEHFPGLQNVNHDFSTLEIIFGQGKADWKASLQQLKGIYVIFDKSNGKKYVGSAYGSEGIWSRWKSYLENGHGGNTELKKIITINGIEYARKNFRFALLEYMLLKTDDNEVINRENFWKEVLLSKNSFGYNMN